RLMRQATCMFRVERYPRGSVSHADDPPTGSLFHADLPARRVCLIWIKARRVSMPSVTAAEREMCWFPLSRGGDDGLGFASGDPLDPRSCRRDDRRDGAP